MSNDRPPSRRSSRLRRGLARHLASWASLAFAAGLAGPLQSTANGHAGESHAEPVEGFISEVTSEGWDGAVGFCFGPNAAGTKIRQYVWEKAGRVWIVEDGEKLATPLIDLSDEVANWRDHGLLGFALDPDFRSNGFIYLLYAVDRHHLLHHGTPAYNPQTDEYFAASIGRLTRYRAEVQNDLRTVDPASRTVLIGDAISNGIPLLHESHGVGSLVFAKDRSLLVSCGDGASYAGMDVGGAAGGSYAPQALLDGIIRPEENVGAFRCQMIDSMNGKILRINPQTGAGYPSNPFYDATDPMSVASRVWALGLRNPFRFSLRSGSGAHEAPEGDPGVLLIGDVGWSGRDEINVFDAPGRNAGWPIHEGMTPHAGYSAATPAGLPQVPAWKPMLDYRWDSRVCLDNLNVFTMSTPESPVLGTSFSGSSPTGGVWYDGDTFPEPFRDCYYFADVNGKWIRCLRFTSVNTLQEVKRFVMLAGQVTCLAVHPETGDLHYLEYPGALHRVYYAPGGNQLPKAVASVDMNHGAAPLVAVFRGDQSYDPAGQPLTYSWDFGDGSAPSLSANPVHVFDAPPGQPATFTVRLTVQDCCGGTDETELLVSVNNSPPQVEIASPVDGTRYPLDQGDLHYPLEAIVSDAEDDATALSYRWVTTLHHNDHTHIEPAITAPAANTVISPAGGDGESYYYRIELTVTDTNGLSTVAETFLYPDEPGTAIIANDDGLEVAFGGSAELDVLGNDRGAMAEVDPASVTIVEPPQHGIATVDAQTGRVRYSHNGTVAGSDEFAYTVRTQSGVVSNAATTRVNFEGGLTGEYFAGPNFSQPVGRRVDREVQFDWHLGSPMEGVPQDQFAVRWTGSVLPEAAGAYTFYLVADDGVRLWVNEELIIDAWDAEAGIEHSATVNLAGGGPVPIQLEYHDDFWNASIELRWSGQFQSKEIISRHDLIPVVAGELGAAVQVLPPEAGSRFKQGTAVELEVAASAAPDDPIATVEFLVDGEVLGVLSDAPYRFNWTPAAEGSYALGARATSTAGVVSDSGAFPLAVNVGPPNEAPTATADAFEVYPGSTTSLDLLANDLDLDGELDPASVEIITQPGQGSLNLDPQSGRLDYQHGGVATGAPDSFSYRVADDNGAFSNPATVTLNVVRTWAGWQSEHPGAGATAWSNGDGDRHPDLLEFALGGDPFSGAVGESGLQIGESATGTIDAWFVRPVGIRGVDVVLEVSADLAQWVAVQSPSITDLGDGREEVRFVNVAGVGGLSRALGFARLRVTQTEGGSAEARSAVMGWYETMFVGGYQTYGLSLAPRAVFAGTVDSVDTAGNRLVVAGASLDAVLDAGRPHHLEFTGGALEGHRFEIDLAGSSGDVVAVAAGAKTNTRPVLEAGAAGAPFVIRPHDLLGEVFPKERFHSARRSPDADRVMFFSAAGYESFYLLNANANYHHWVAASDSELLSQAGRVIAPGEGLFLIRRTEEPLAYLRVGEVRGYAFAQPLTGGFQLIAEPVPLDRSPVSRKLTLADGFSGGLRSAVSDMIYQWKGDGSAGEVGYDTFFLLEHVEPYRHWTRAGDAGLPNLDNELLFRGRRATFLRLLGSDRPDYVVPPGWNPAPTPTDTQ